MICMMTQCLTTLVIRSFMVTTPASHAYMASNTLHYSHCLNAWLIRRCHVPPGCPAATSHTSNTRAEVYTPGPGTSDSIDTLRWYVYALFPEPHTGTTCPNESRRLR